MRLVTLAISLALFVPLSAAASVLCALGPGVSSYQPSADQRPSPDATQLANRVNAAGKTICGSNCPSVALFRNSTAPNAALLVNQGEGKLVYAPQFFAAVYQNYGDAGIMAILAHELGHALDDVMGAAWIANGWSSELRADSWAGCTLARANLSEPEMRAALAALEKYPPANTSWNLRVPAIRSGYTRCGGAPSVFGQPAAPKKSK